MKFCPLLAFFLIFFMIFPHFSLAQDLTVGVSPPLLDLGEMKSGSAKLGSFNIITISKKPLLVHLIPESGTIDFFNLKYRDYIFNYSEEDVSSWIKFFANPVELKSADGNVTPIRGSKEINFLIEVPENADPGYHIIIIKPVPSAPTGRFGQAGTQIVAVTAVTAIFKVSGAAIRKGIILDSTAVGYSGDKLIIKNYFQNTGTDTISAKAYQKIYDKDWNFITEIHSSEAFVKPKEVKVFETFLPVTGLSLGEYNAVTSVNYKTGSADKNSTITLYEMPKIEKVEYIPIWPIIIAIIIVVSIIIYRRIR